VIDRRFVGMLVGVAGFVSLAASAWAQDYTSATTTGRYVAPPANATSLGVDTFYSGQENAAITLPFDFPYYGRIITSGVVASRGFFQPLVTTASTSNGNGAFPLSVSSTFDGIIAPCWDGFDAGPSHSAGQVYTWTFGAAPSRTFVISWEGVKKPASGSSNLTFQLQLIEGTGEIVFAYPAADWGPNLDYSMGIDSPVDTRYFCPLNTNSSNASNPGTDYVLTPRTLTFTGRLTYDRIVSDATGIGNAVQPNASLAGLRLEMRRDGAILANWGTTAADGSFSIPALGVASGSTGSFVLFASTTAATVTTTTGGSTAQWTVSSSLGFQSGANLGAVNLGSSADATGAIRAAMHVALVTEAARAFVAAHSNTPIPQLACLADNLAPYSSDYVPDAGSGIPLLQISGAAGNDPDSWDAGIITKLYARHVLRAIAALPSGTPDYRFDAVSTDKNAFAEGFGCALWAAVSGSSQLIDGTGASTALVYDLESPVIASPKGSDVAACVAAGLVDLVDAANESSDRINGAASPGSVVQIVDAFSVAPTVSAFVQAWSDAGFDSESLARAFIGAGALRDDATEPNDDITESVSLGTVGVRRSGQVLNRFNEDWYSLTLPSPLPTLMADATYSNTGVAVNVGFEIRSAAGALIATGVPVGSTGQIRATAGPLAAGTYKLGVRHLGGASVVTYTVQAYEPLSIAETPMRDWTLGRPYDEALGVTGGVAPYTLSAATGTLPPGLIFNSVTQRAIGTPTTPGVYQLSIGLHDDGLPANALTRDTTVTIHDVLKVAVARYVGFPAGRTLDLNLPTSGGTPPFTLSMPAGALPQGLAFGPNSLHVTGTAAAQPSVTLELDGVDVAGSADHIATRAVVAVATDVANAPTDLAAGDDACGWWFDAVKGSAVSFKVKTAKGRVKRLLTGAVLAPDRSEVLTAKVKGKLGGLSVSKLVCPASGRYYVIAASTEGEATQLLGNVAVNPPKSGKAKLVDFVQTDTTTVEVGALPGATLTLKFKGDKKQQLTPKVVSVTDPDGTPVVFGGNVVTDGVAGTLTMTFAEGGTWTVVLGATSATGTPGKLSYSYRLAQPKGVTYSAE
jgi:hypothetical protein